MSSQRIYEPYQRKTDCQHGYKGRKARKKQTQSFVKKVDVGGKTCPEECIEKTVWISTESHESRLGDYILTEAYKPNCFCKAMHIHSGKEFTCFSLEKSTYISAVTPYYLVNSHENINEIVDIISGKDFTYLVFEKSYGDLHSYIRSKRKLKEDEACKLFKQIASVVFHCHNAGVAIRDLKLRKFVFKDPER